MFWIAQKKRPVALNAMQKNPSSLQSMFFFFNQEKPHKITHFKPKQLKMVILDGFS